MQEAQRAGTRRARAVDRPTKGEQTRRRLMTATRKVLARNGYQATRIEDVAKAAGVAKGTFYLYFENKEAATMAVMQQVMAESEAKLRATRTLDDPFLEILEPTVAYARVIFEQADLFRAFVQFSHHYPQAAQYWSEVTHRWLAGVESVMDRRLGRGRTDPATRGLVVYAMSWMVDGVLLSFLTRDYPRLEEVRQQPEQIGEALSVLWYRAVYGEDPDLRHLTSGRAVLDFRLARQGNAGVGDPDGT
jgi:AcrR family transcriptional regulator